MNKIKLLSFIFSFFSLVTQAQDDQVKVIVVEPDESDAQSREQMNKYAAIKNYVYLNPYLIGRGAFVMGYERMLSPIHALNGEFGLTYRDFIYEGFGEKDISDDAEVAPGKYVSVNYKLYPSQNQDYDGNFYISPGFIHRSYNLTEMVSFNGGEEEAKVGYSMTDLSLKLGYVYESWLFDSGLIVDVYMGFGLRNIKEHTYELINSGSGNFELEAKTDEKKSTSALYLGFKTGFVF